MQRYYNYLISRKAFNAVNAMGFIDIVIICCFLPSLYFGAKNGFIKQIISLAIIILGIKLSIKFSPYLADWLVNRVAMQPMWVSVLSFAIVFIAVALAGAVLEGVLNKVVDVTMLGGFNRLLGILLSMVKVAIVLSLVAYVVRSANELLDFISEDELRESRFFQPLLDLADRIFPALKYIIQ